MIAVMAKKKSTTGAGKKKHKGTLVGLRPDAALHAELDALAKKESRTLANYCLVLVKEALAARKSRNP